MSGDLSGVMLNLVDSLDQAQALKRWLGERRPRNVIGLDTETSGLDPYAPGARLRLVQFGDGDQGWAVPWEDWRGLALEVLADWQGDWTGHNIASFDVKWIEEHSPHRFERHRIRDGMLAAHIIDPLGPGGLKPLAQKYIDRRATAGEHLLQEGMRKHRWTWDTVPIDFKPWWAYGALDAVLSYRLDLTFAAQVGAGGRYADIYDLEMAVRHVVTAMEQRGARIDLEYVRATGEQQAAYAAAIHTWGRKAYGVSLRSNRALVALFEDMGETITVFSEKTGSKSVNKYQLQMFCDSPITAAAQLAEQVLAMRRAGKFATSYFDSLSKHAVSSVDGDLVHADIRTLAARTSRMSISRPPLQQLPKNDAMVRTAFVPREGRVLVPVDYEQIEMRLCANFSKDPGLIEAFRTADATGIDFFTVMGRDIYREPRFAKADKRRGLVKSSLYGKIYGAGIPTMAETAGVSPEQMRPVVQAIDATYPGIKRFMSEIEDMGIRRERSEGQGYVVTPTGRRLPCDEGKVYTLVNYLHQGHAAEIFKRALVDLDMAGWGDYLVLPVHDEILLDVPSEYQGEAMTVVPKVMANMVDYAVPLTAEADGPFEHNWGQKYR